MGEGGRRGDRVGERVRGGERGREGECEGECAGDGEGRAGGRRRSSEPEPSFDMREAETLRVEPLTTADGKAAVGLGGRMPFPGSGVSATLDFCAEGAFR